MKKWCFLIAFICVSLVNAQQKPNVLIIITDDLGYHDLSITGSQLYDTPHIDSLATQSVQFTNGYSSYPRCTPSRYGLMTATYPVNEDKGYLGGIDEDKNFVKQFNNAGYNTSFVGKWHLGKGKSSPKKFGYQHSFAAGEAGGVGQRFYPYNTKKNGKPAKYDVPDVIEASKEGDYISDVMTSETINFINENGAEKPFLAILSFYAVHTPLEAKPEDKARNEKELASMTFEGPAYIKEGSGRRKMHQDDPDYAGMVENVDENVGRLLQSLRDLNIDKNTIIIFTSDHGGLSNDGHKGERQLATSNLPLKAGKGWLYEGGIRVPYFISWGDVIQPSVDTSSIVMGMDIFPTVLDLALGKKVNDVDGMSLAPVIQQEESWENRVVYWHSRKARPHSTGDAKMSVVRAGDFKLVHYFKEGTVELYNLKDDPGELVNLASELPAKTKELQALLDAWKTAYLIPEKMNMWKDFKKSQKEKKKKN